MPDGAFIAFIDLLPTKVGTGFIGAVLVTDFHGVPVEFRCTHPVKPTEIQKQLYGSTLERYIGVELCGKPLLKSLENRPKLAFVKSEPLLGVRDANSPPLLFLRRAGEVLRIESPGTGAITEMKVDSKNASVQSIVVKVSGDFPDDLHDAKDLVEEILENVDAVEPFERIAKAIEALSKQDTRFQ
jgi:hypothetical protein